MFIFEWSFGSYTLKQLVVDLINYNKMYILIKLKEIFANTLKKIGKIGWDSRIICILKHYWCLNWALVWCQRFLNKAFANSIFNWEENKLSLSLMVTDVLFYYNNKYNHSTTKITLREILFNYKNKEIIEKLIINIEKSMKNFIKKFITMLEILY